MLGLGGLEPPTSPLSGASFIASNMHDKNIMLIYRNEIRKNNY